MIIFSDRIQPEVIDKKQPIPDLFADYRIDRYIS